MLSRDEDWFLSLEFAVGGGSRLLVRRDAHLLIFVLGELKHSLLQNSVMAILRL